MEKLGFKDYLTVLALFLVFYLIMSAGSLMQVATGEDITYSSFWHGPWKLIFKLFGIF